MSNEPYKNELAQRLRNTVFSSGTKIFQLGADEIEALEAHNKVLVDALVDAQFTIGKLKTNYSNALSELKHDSLKIIEETLAQVHSYQNEVKK